jgi:hypothetical protein
MLVRTTDADLIQLYEIINSAAEENGKDELVVPTGILRKLLVLAKLAKRPKAGRPPMGGRADIAER